MPARRWLLLFCLLLYYAESVAGSKSASHSYFCPLATDLTVGYTASLPTAVTLFNGGWNIYGGGSAATKASFNLLGGSVEYDFDVNHVDGGVNANIYSISPREIGPSGFSQELYCDGSKDGEDWCLEVDFIESNGNCGGQTTLHSIQGTGPDGCTAWGCAHQYTYNGVSSFHMRVTFAADGTWVTYRDGQAILPSALKPTPNATDWAIISSFYRDQGAVLYSSQWVGWVPVETCPQHGDLSKANFTIRNLRINGTVVQGPMPTRC